MNDIFNFFSPLSFVKSGIVSYNPLINYDWSTTTTSGLRYLKDVGSSPTYNASMYFGRGAYLNGVDQTITVPINTTIQTSLKRVNGVVTINETSQALTNYVISGLGVHKDYYLFTRLLTTTEKDSYTNTPELFYAMAQADSTCVLNMPMCETDGYARNMKSYSLGSELITNGSFDIDTNWVKGSDWSITNGKAIHSSTSFSYLSQNAGLISGKTYRITFTVENYVSGNVVCSSVTGSRSNIIPATGNTNYSIYVVSNGSPLTLFSDGVLNIDNVSAKEVTGQYAISNYTTSVIDNAKNLQYGLQTCKFVRDSLGVIQSASSYLECDGVGYSDTGWIPNTREDWTIEVILPRAKVNSYEGIGIENGSDSIWIRRDINSATARYGMGSVVALDNQNTKAYMYVCCVLNSSINTVSFFGNSVYSGVSQDNLVAVVSNFTLGKVNKRTDKNMNNPLRLFKVHNKALTQSEITANYNSYVAKGLLS